MDGASTEAIRIAFQANTSALWRIAPGLSEQSWTVGVAAGTNPAINGQNLAFQGSDGRLWTVPATGVPVQSPWGMAPGTSPVIF